MNVEIHDLAEAIVNSFDGFIPVTREMILERSELFKELSDLCSKNHAFQLISIRAGRLIAYLESTEEESDLVLLSWELFVEEISAAETVMHADIAILTYIPIIYYFIINAK